MNKKAMTIFEFQGAIKRYSQLLLLTGFVLVMIWQMRTTIPKLNEVQAYPIATSVSLTAMSYPAGTIPSLFFQPLLPPPTLNQEAIQSWLFLPLVNRAQASPKKGLAWGHYVQNDERALNTRWYHNWDSVAYPNTLPGLEFVPYLWCDYTNGSNPVDLLQRAVTYLPGGSNYAGYLLFLNEPDLGLPQCDMTISEAALFYLKTKQYLPQAKLVGPNVFTGNNDFQIQAIYWVTQWRETVYACSFNPACNPYFNNPNVPKGYPQMAGYAIHPYSQIPVDNLNYVSQFYNTMQTIWNEGSKELWVTEFGYCLHYGDSGNRVLNTVNGFESNPFVTRYAYFTTRTPNFEEVTFHTPELQACDGVGEPWDTDLLDPTTNWQTLSRTGQAYSQVATP